VLRHLLQRYRLGDCSNHPHGERVMCMTCRRAAWPELADKAWVKGNPRAAKQLAGELIT
jgi:hypothetical protein